MSDYKYEDERHKIFTDEGQRTFLKIRDRTQYLLGVAGAVRMQEMIASATGSSWVMFACADRMVELGELIELTKPGKVWDYHRIFVVPIRD